jgi:DNA (cytosine-5)-methyltransferase 1
MTYINEKLLTIQETALYLSVNPQTLRRWDSSGKLVAMKINKRGDRRYKFSDVQKIPVTKTKLKVVSLFSGCGGMDLGFSGGFDFLGKWYEPHNYEIVYANDNYKNACETYKLNFKSDHIICGDFTEIIKNPDTIPDCDVILGGFPCQDFSVAGKRQGLSVKRGQLYLSMVKLVKIKKPKAFVAENVKGLMNIEKGEVIKLIEQDFAAVGYEVTVNLFNSADYGVPETRERVIICGIRKDLKTKFELPKPTHYNPKGKDAHVFKQLGMKPWVTAKEALKDLEKFDEGGFTNHYWSKAKLTPNTQGNNIISADKPGPTMRAEHHGNIEFHYGLPRRLSAREAARIQSFPDNFEFYRSTTDAYKQVGNAVAPLFAWHIAKSLQSSIL